MKKYNNPLGISKEQQLRELKTAKTETIEAMLKIMENLLELDEKLIDPSLVSPEDKALYEEDIAWLKVSIVQYKNELRLRQN